MYAGICKQYARNIQKIWKQYANTMHDVYMKFTLSHYEAAVIVKENWMKCIIIMQFILFLSLFQTLYWYCFYNLSTCIWALTLKNNFHSKYKFSTLNIFYVCTTIQSKDHSVIIFFFLSIDSQQWASSNLSRTSERMKNIPIWTSSCTHWVV